MFYSFVVVILEFVSGSCFLKYGFSLDWCFLFILGFCLICYFDGDGNFDVIFDFFDFVFDVRYLFVIY